MPQVGTIKRHSGVAGQFSYTAEVTYPGEPSSEVTFVGSIYGGPVVMVLPGGIQTFVDSDVVSRHGGQLSPEWVCRFFSESP